MIVLDLLAGLLLAFFEAYLRALFFGAVVGHADNQKRSQPLMVDIYRPPEDKSRGDQFLDKCSTPVGFTQVDNSCWFASVLQLFVQVPEFRKLAVTLPAYEVIRSAMIDYGESCERRTAVDQDTVRKMRDQMTKAFDLQNISGTSQQDATEALRQIFSGLDSQPAWAAEMSTQNEVDRCLAEDGPVLPCTGCSETQNIAGLSEWQLVEGGRCLSSKSTTQDYMALLPIPAGKTLGEMMDIVEDASNTDSSEIKDLRADPGQWLKCGSTDKFDLKYPIADEYCKAGKKKLDLKNLVRIRVSHYEGSAYLTVLRFRRTELIRIPVESPIAVLTVNKDPLDQGGRILLSDKDGKDKFNFEAELPQTGEGPDTATFRLIFFFVQETSGKTLFGSSTSGHWYSVVRRGERWFELDDGVVMERSKEWVLNKVEEHGRFLVLRRSSPTGEPASKSRDLPSQSVQSYSRLSPSTGEPFPKGLPGSPSQSVQPESRLSPSTGGPAPNSLPGSPSQSVQSDSRRSSSTDEPFPKGLPDPRSQSAQSGSRLVALGLLLIACSFLAIAYALWLWSPRACARAERLGLSPP